MKPTCERVKTCCVCQRILPNLAFQSAAKGRTRLKPYCKTCAPIYHGIRKGLIPKEWYIGLSYDTTILQGNHYGEVIFLKNGSYKKIPKEEAIRYVRQGMAHVISESVIEYPPQLPPGLNSVKKYVHQRDQKKCHYCGQKGTTLDHLIPQYDGGLWSPLNLVCACSKCNGKKTNMSVSTFRKRWREKTISLFHKNKKKCELCGNIFSYRLFPSLQNHCFHCKKFERACELGFLESTDLIRLQKSSSISFALDEEINVLDFLGNPLVTVSGAEAHWLRQAGAVELTREKTAQCLFSEKQMQLLFPQKSLAQLGREDNNRLCQTKSVIAIVEGFPQQIPTKIANDLIRRNLAEKIHGNRLCVFLSQSEWKQFDPKSTKVQKHSSSSSVTLCIENRCISSIPLGIGQNLVKNGVARYLTKTRIELTTDWDTAKAKVPFLEKLKNGTSVSLRDINKKCIGVISFQAASKLIDKKAAIYFGKNQIQVFESAEVLQKKFGIFIKMPEMSLGVYFENRQIWTVPLHVANNIVKNGMAVFLSEKRIQLTVDAEIAKAKEPFLQKIKKAS